MIKQEDESKQIIPPHDSLLGNEVRAGRNKIIIHCSNSKEEKVHSFKVVAIGLG